MFDEAAASRIINPRSQAVRSAIGMNSKTFLLTPVSLSTNIAESKWLVEYGTTATILYVLWLNNRFLTDKEISESIASDFLIKVDTERLAIALQGLKNTEGIIVSLEGTYKITEERRTSLQRDLEDAEQAERRAQEKFIEQVSEVCPDIDPKECWSKFNQQCLLPMVLDMGARTYEFLLDGTLSRAMTFDDNAFFAAYEPQDREALRAAIFEYISPDDDVIRNFLLRTLDAAFFLEASGLQFATLEKLASSGARPSQLTLFLDTNLLFSAMELHDNPSNQSVKSLLQIMDEMAETITCKLLVLPITVEEFRRALIGNRESLKNIPMSSKIVTAARESGRFSGLKLRYLESWQSGMQNVSPDDYFRPYISNPVAVMQTKGVELFNERTDEYKMRQDVVDGINNMWESEEGSRKTDTRYRAIEHDMLLWHFVNDKRPAYVESPSEAECWIVTIDNRLLRYDRETHNRYTGKPVCIHPSVLIQMLRFWVPRTAAFESAVLESLRIPFIFRNFDTESEAIALRILGALAQFEIRDISPDAIKQLLVDDAVNMGFRQTTDRDDEIALVEHGLSSVESSLRANLAESTVEVEEYKKIVEQQNQQLKSLEDKAEQEQEGRQKLENQLASIDSAKRKRAFFLKWTLLASLGAFVGPSIIWLMALGTDLGVAQYCIVMFGCAGCGLLVVIRIADWRGSTITEIEAEPLYQKLRRWRIQLYGLLGTIAIAVIAAAVWDTLKGLF